MAVDDKPMIIVENLVKSYNSGRSHIINNLSLEIRKGEMIILHGSSGCGKTTLLNLIAGLDRPTSGKITIDDTRIDEMTEDEMARFRLLNVGFIFQDYNLISDLTIFENVALPLKLAGKKDLESARNLLKEFEIDKLSDQKANSVSGGEAQRAAIARAMANNPKILLADEPTGNLDKWNEENVMHYFKKIQEDFNTTILLATHNENLSTFGTRIVSFKEIDDKA